MSDLIPNVNSNIKKLKKFNLTELIPRIKQGLITASSKHFWLFFFFSSTKSQAAFSAKILDFPYAFVFSGSKI